MPPTLPPPHLYHKLTYQCLLKPTCIYPPIQDPNSHTTQSHQESLPQCYLSYPTLTSLPPPSSHPPTSLPLAHPSIHLPPSYPPTYPPPSLLPNSRPPKTHPPTHPPTYLPTYLPTHPLSYPHPSPYLLANSYLYISTYTYPPTHPDPHPLSIHTTYLPTYLPGKHIFSIAAKIQIS